MIYIFAGHTGTRGANYDPGAAANGYVEAQLAIGLRDKVTEILKAHGMQVTNDNDSDPLSIVLQKTDSRESDVVFDIHWNAATPQATGVEVFVPERSTDAERKFAGLICDALATQMGINNRGVKSEVKSARKRLGVMRKAGMNMLVEVCFITNTDDMARYNMNKDAVAAKIAGHLMAAEKHIQ